jgi:hypothetical protein
VTNHGAVETFEVERKYAVSNDAVLPDASSFAALGLTLAASERHHMHATYFDTPDGALARQKMALRRRRGGSDAGWHLKAKDDGATRELLWPDGEEMPTGLLAELGTLLDDAALALVDTIATLHTIRQTALLCDGAGVPLIELADDQVDATNELNGRTRTWREWEAELMPNTDAQTLDLIEPLLTNAGAVRVRGTSKIQRTMQQEMH